MYNIKLRIKDFVVKEVLDFNSIGDGDYGYFILNKIGLNTIDAISLLSRYLKTNRKNIGYAGLKDKNAETYQYISIFKPDLNKISKLQLENMSLEFVGYGKDPISIGCLEGNDFIITVRNLDCKYKKIKFFENYFDEQRFSSHNVEIGRNIVKRNYQIVSNLLKLDSSDVNSIKKHDKNILKFYINAYQSYLWNRVVAELLRKNKDYSEVDYSLGKFVFLKNKIKNFKVPLLNFDTEFNNKLIEEVYNNIMKIEGISKGSFLIREVPELINEGVERDVFVDVKIKSSFMEDELDKGKFKQILEFKLPKGSYATLLVKKMFSF